MRADAAALDKIAAGSAQLNLDLSPAQIKKLYAHLKLLAQWNKHFNLTAITDMQKMITHHVLDSLSIAPYVRGRNLLDVGSGGGFPGLVLAIAKPNLKITLLDSRRKRTEFLNFVIGELKIKNSVALHTRMQDYTPPEKFATITTRAFGKLDYTLKITAAALKHRGRLLAMKGRMPYDEIKAIKNNLRGQIKVQELQVPFLDANRNLIIITNKKNA